MKRLLLVLGLCAGAYQGGSVLGYQLGVQNATAMVDWEWARMLENGMVGPGSTTRPGTSTGLDSLQIVGSV